MIEQNPAAATKLRAAYDAWWTDVQPLLVNEDAVGPKMNPFKEIYWKQFSEQPDQATLDQMDPSKFEERANRPNARKKKGEE